MKDKYIITGGQMNNKGAQAMTFITISEMTSRHPELKPAVVVPENARGEEKDYAFEMITPPSWKKIFLIGLPGAPKIYRLLTKDLTIKKYFSLLEESAIQIDVSGYLFGSNWSAGLVIDYLIRIEMAKVYGITVYLMPQSFGPFDFKGFKGLIIKLLAKKTLPYCKTIMARELEGRNGLIKEFHLSNVIKTYDMVLQNRDITNDRILFNDRKPLSISVDKNSIAIIPNKKNDRFGKNLMNLYITMIEYLRSINRKIYLLYFAVGDITICQEIKKMFPNDDNVIYVPEEINCLDFDEVMKKFDYVIASRFHSIVYAYKNCVPAVVIGWATKYAELTCALKQEEYLFDVRNDLSHEAIVNKIKFMEESYEKESMKIAERLNEIRKNNVFDYVVL